MSQYYFLEGVLPRAPGLHPDLSQYVSVHPNIRCQKGNLIKGSFKSLLPEWQFDAISIAPVMKINEPRPRN